MANNLFKQRRWEAAVAICDEAIDRYGGDQSLDVSRETLATHPPRDEP